MERNGFVFYRSFAEALSDLDEITRAHCYDALIEYALNGNEPSLNGIESAVFKLIKPQIDANNRRYENGCKGAEFGKLGGRPRKNPIGDNQKNPKETPKEKDKEKEKDKDKDKENVKDKEKDKEKESRAKTTVFTPPSFEEVNKYCTERNNGVDPQAFIDFYSSKGWLIGKSKMKDWKAAIRTWERRDRETRLPPIENNKAKIDEFFRRSMGL